MRHRLQSSAAEHPTLIAEIDTDGGRLASFTVDGHELLVTEGAKPTRWGSFPMIPWCGRLAHGRLVFDGSLHEFSLTSPPHANHGITHLKPWDVVATTDHSFELQTSLDGEWPFGGSATQTFSIANGALTVQAVVTAHDMPMPAMAGWHPWFRRVLDTGAVADLRFDAASAYETDADMIPTGSLIEIPNGPLNETVVGMVGHPTITWPGTVTLDIGSSFDHWVVFTEPDHALCVEPQSGPPNQVNAAPVTLGPGESLTGTMTLTASTD